jgi:ABC-type multidrug transport system fused ATPase/permease subunit
MPSSTQERQDNLLSNQKPVVTDTSKVTTTPIHTDLLDNSLKVNNESEASTTKTTNTKRTFLNTITGAISDTWNESKLAFSTRVFFVCFSTAVPLYMAFMSGQISSTLLKSPDAHFSIMGIVGLAFASLYTMDLVNRSYGLFNQKEQGRQEAATHSKLAKVLRTWTYEELLNANKAHESQRYLTYANESYRLVHATIDLAANIITVGVAIALVSQIHWILAAAPISFLALRINRDIKFASQHFQLQEELDKKRVLNDAYHNASMNSNTVIDTKMLQNSKNIHENYQSGLREIHKEEQKSEFKRQLYRLVLDSIPNLTIVTGIGFLAQAYNSGTMAVPSILSGVGYLLSLGFQCRGIGYQLGQITLFQGKTALGLNFLESARKELETLPLSHEAPKIILEQAKIFSDENRCLLNVDHLEIEPGTILGLAGLEGAGKTTILKALFGRMGLSEGVVRVLSSDGEFILNNSNVNKVEQFSRFVSQATINLPKHTIKELLDYGIPHNFKGDPNSIYSTDEVIRLCALKEDVDKLPFGLDTRIGIGVENGVFLNEGFLKKLSVAMAIRSKPGVLIFDEPTSNISKKSAKIILDNIYKEARKNNQTVVIVSHNLENYAEVDRLLVLEDGKIVEDGPPKTLAKQNGRYRQLLNASIDDLKNQIEELDS